jgi:hypothetical protein
MNSWGSTNGHSYPEAKGPPKEVMRGLTSLARQVIKKRQKKKRRQRDKMF